MRLLLSRMLGQCRTLETRQQKLIEENQILRKEVEERFSTRSILGSTPSIQQIRSLLEKTAQSSVSVLVTGENGTGKELSARAIHYMSSRGSKPFVAVNCAALPEQLVESELFGIEKGVATGVERRVGRIESANGGTLFLDEIGDLSMTAQAKLLRVLQEREVDWVGGRKPVSVDIRLVAATNKDLKEEIQRGTFSSGSLLSSQCRPRTHAGAAGNPRRHSDARDAFSAQAGQGIGSRNRGIRA